MGLALALFLGLGCGLAEYEQKMKAEQQRVEKIDKILAEENQHLVGPLQMPERQKQDENGKLQFDENKKPVFEDALNFFMRPPKGINVDKPKQLKGILYVYPGENGRALYVGAPPVKKTIQKDTDKKSNQKDPDKKMSQEDFEKLVCQSLGIHNPPKSKPEQKEALGDRRLEFRHLEAGGSPRYQVYFYQVGDDRLAIVFQGPADSANDASVDASLKTLEIGPRAFLLRAAFAQGAKAFNQRRFLMIAEDAKHRR
jgi:hypothetical protein